MRLTHCTGSGGDGGDYSSDQDFYSEVWDNHWFGSSGSAYAATNEARVGRAAPTVGSIKRAVSMHGAKVKWLEVAVCEG